MRKECVRAPAADGSTFIFTRKKRAGRLIGCLSPPPPRFPLGFPMPCYLFSSLNLFILSPSPKVGPSCLLSLNGTVTSHIHNAPCFLRCATLAHLNSGGGGRTVKKWGLRASAGVAGDKRKTRKKKKKKENDLLPPRLMLRAGSFRASGRIRCTRSLLRLTRASPPKAAKRLLLKSTTPPRRYRDHASHFGKISLTFPIARASACVRQQFDGCFQDAVKKVLKIAATSCG